MYPKHIFFLKRQAVKETDMQIWELQGKKMKQLWKQTKTKRGKKLTLKLDSPEKPRRKERSCFHGNNRLAGQNKQKVRKT